MLKNLSMLRRIVKKSSPAPVDAAPPISKNPLGPFEDIDFFDFGSMGLFA
jgi:hypothetical protein